MTAKKPSQAEEEFVARQEAETKRRLAVEVVQKMAASEREVMKQAHFMHCPKCGYQLETINFRDVAIERCYHCNGVWLDAGELESLAGKEPNFMQRLLSVFKE